MLDKIKKAFTKDERVKVKFFSGKAGKKLTARVIKENNKTYILELSDGNIIKKKKHQVEVIGE